MSEKKIVEYQKKLPAWVTIGFIRGAHGIKGEIKVSPTTDDPQRFQLLEHVSLEFPKKNLLEYSIEGVRFQKNFVLLKLAGIEDRTAAENLKGIEINIPLEDCLELPDDQYYYFHLIGLMVYSTAGDLLGKITDVLEMPANDVYVVQAGENEILLPAIKDVVKEVDLENGVMTIELLEGLI